MLSLEEVKLFFIKNDFNTKVRLHIWKQLSKQLKYNLDLTTSLEQARDRAKRRRKPYHKALTLILRRMSEGHSLATSLEGLASTEEIMLIEGGQDSAKMDETLGLCIQLIEAKQKIVSSTMKAVAYPLVLIAMLIALLLVVALFVMPNITSLMDPSRMEGMASFMYSVSNFIASESGIITGIAIFAFFFISIVTLPYFTGPIRVKLECLPPWSFYKMITGSVWLFTISTLMQSGRSQKTIIDIQLRTKDLSPYLKERLTLLKKHIALGKSIGEALTDSKTNFPDEEIVEDLVIFDKLPHFNTTLYEIAKDYLNTGMQRITTNANVINGVCMLLIILAMACVALAIGSIQQQLSNSGAF